jgi:hypothetical protein
LVPDDTIKAITTHAVTTHAVLTGKIGVLCISTVTTVKPQPPPSVRTIGVTGHVSPCERQSTVGFSIHVVVALAVPRVTLFDLDVPTAIPHSVVDCVELESLVLALREDAAGVSYLHRQTHAQLLGLVTVDDYSSLSD